MLKDERFSSSLRFIGVLILYIPLGVLVPLLLSAVLRGGFKGRRLFRALLYCPSVLGGTLLGLIYMVCLSQIGPVAEAFNLLGIKGLEKVYLLGRSWSAINTLAFLFIIWFRIGFGVIFFLSAMSNINTELFDAADVDGADSFQKFIHVTIPSIVFAIQFFTVLIFIEVFARMYGLLFTTTKGGPGFATTTFEYAVCNLSFTSMQKGYASAYAVALLIACTVIAVIQIQLFRKDKGR
jgi:multiple sugar transport system permease protein/raffinose/stachyose/melibiose transport system permease protein